MKIETIGGALIAAAILFLTGMLALLTQDGVTEVGDISQLSWIVLGVGALIGFGKDFQAITVRRYLANATGSSNVHSPPAVGIIAILLACFMLSGCGTTRPPIDSMADAIAVTAADVETAAQAVKSLCRNTQPGGPCASNAAITTEQKEGLKDGLQEVVNGLNFANMAVSNDDIAGANGGLARTNALLAVLQAELTRLQN